MIAAVSSARRSIVCRIVALRWRTPVTVAMAVMYCALCLACAGGSTQAAEDDADEPRDLTGTYVCEQFRLELTRTSDGTYDGTRTALEGSSVRGTLSASAKVAEHAPDRIVLQGDFARFKETFPFQATYQGATLRVSSIFSEYRLMRIPSATDHREFAGRGFGGRPIRLVLETEPEKDRPGAALLLVDEVVRHAVEYHRYNDRLAGTITLDERKLDFTGMLRGLLLTLEIGPESYALAAVGGSAINSDALQGWFLSSAAYDAAARQLVFKIFTRGQITQAQRDQAEFRFALLSKDGLRSAGRGPAIDLSAAPLARAAAGAKPRQTTATQAYRTQFAVSAEPALLEGSSVIRLEQVPIEGAVVVPR